MVRDDKVKKLKSILVLVLLLALLASPITVLASDITGAKYYGLIQVSNTGTANSSVSTNCSISTTNLINAGYLNSSANNCALQDSGEVDLAFMPSVNSSYPWCLWVPTIGADGILTDFLYTANSTGGKIRYFPAAGGMTTADNTTLELGDNFTIEQSGWWDTDYGTAKYSVEKPAAFGVYVSDTVSGNITASFLTWGGNQTEILRPMAVGDYTNIPNLTGAPTHWEAVDEVVADDATSYVDTQVNAETRDTFELEDPTTITASENISQVSVFIRGYTGANPADLYRPLLRLGTNETLGSAYQQDLAWASKTEVLAKPGGGSWTLADIQALQVGCGVKSASSAECRVTQTYVIVTYQESEPTTPAVTATDVTNGEHVVTASMDSPFLSLGVDAGSDIPPIGGSLEFNAPMWQKDQDADPFTSIDANAHSCDVDGATWTDEGYDFDGTNDEIVLTADNTTLSPLNFVAGDFSIEMWFYPVGTGGTNIALLYRGDLNVKGYALRYREDDNRVILDTFQGGAQQTTGIAGFPQNSWYHVVVTRSGANAIIYKNGVDLEATTGTHINPVTCNIATRFGENNDGAYDYEGIIGEVRIYSQALSPAEVLKNYNATKFKYTSGDIYTYSTLDSVPDNDNDWTFLQNNVMPYMRYHKIWVGGVLQQQIMWEYDTTFTDMSGQNHDATPTFRTTSSDADVSAELVSFVPVEEARAPAYVLEEAVPFIEETPVVVSEFGVTPPAGTFPLAGVITVVAAATGRPTPAQLPLVLIAGFTIIGLSLAVSGTMRKHGSGTIFVKVVIIAAMMGVFVAIGNFGIDFWMIFVFLIIGVAISMASRHTTWQ